MREAVHPAGAGNRRRWAAWLLVALVAVAILVLIFWLREPREAPPDAPGPGADAAPPMPSTPNVASGRAARQFDQPSGDVTVDGAAALVLRIEAAWKRLQALEARAAHPDERRAVVMALRAELRAASQAQAAEAALHFLATGSDVATGLPFAPARDGFLETPPSLRTLLLDELERLDPALARSTAAAIFSTSTSADEWAVALRIVGHGTSPGDTAGRAQFNRYVEALLANDAWQSTPSAGFLHAFDAAVHSGEPALVPTLAGLAGADSNQPVTFAARLALERLATANYAATIRALADDRTLLADDGAFRGLLLARADVSRPDDRLALEQVLRNPATPAAELQAWAEHFPHRAKHLSNNLLTSDRPTPIPELARMDRAALVVVREWQADPALAALRPELETVRQRLERYVAQADRHLAP